MVRGVTFENHRFTPYVAFLRIMSGAGSRPARGWPAAGQWQTSASHGTVPQPPGRARQAAQHA
eukprot:1918948-Prymnesium_polylepis.1